MLKSVYLSAESGASNEESCALAAQVSEVTGTCVGVRRLNPV